MLGKMSKIKKCENSGKLQIVGKLGKWEDLYNMFYNEH